MPPDPYRTLGLTRGASLDEVKRAYRRLAKANHPDRAGEGSLARFLEIQDAYDRIAGGAAGTSGAGTSAAGPRRPWDADPTRADATRRAYGSRTRRTRPSAPPGSGGGTARTAGEAGAGRAGPSGSGPDAPPSPEGDPTGASRSGSRGRRPPNKATLGSTSYDGADEGPFEPDWGGASWYGTTTGTYWTLNPKEYADPRKHGPEYQARARRAASAGRGPEAAEGGAADGGDPATPTGARPAGPAGAPRHTTSSWWEATSAAGPAAEPAPDAWPGGSTQARRAATAEGAPRSGTPPTRPADPDTLLPPLFDAGRWLEGGRGGIPARVGRAVLGWAPVALGIGWLAGELTGCGRYSAGCDAAVAPLAWLAQVAVLALLLLVPRLGSAATVATLVTLAAAVPGALILSASGTDAADTMAPLALGGLLVVGWVVGILAGVAREVRALRARPPTGPEGGARPVS